MNLQRSTIAVFGSTLIRNIASFLAIAVFSRSVGVAGLGSFFLFQSVLSMVSLPVDMGIRRGIEKRLSEGKPAGETVSTGLTMKLVLLAIFLVPIVLFQEPLNSYIGAEVSYLLGIGLILYELGGVGKFTLRGELRVTESAIFAPLQTILWAIGGWIFIQIGFSEIALFWAYLLGLAGVLVLSWILIDTRLSAPSLSRAKSLFGYSKFAAIGSVGGVIYSWTDVILLGFFISQEAVGAYEVAWKVAAVSLLLSQAIRSAIFPSANQWGAENDFVRLEELIERTFVPSLYLVIPAFIGGIILGDEILDLWFAVQYPLIYLVIIGLLFEKLQRAILLPLIAPMHAVGHVDYGAYTTIIGVVVNITANLALIPPFGVAGAALGTTLGAFANTASHAWLLSTELDIRFPLKAISWLVVSAILMGVGVYSITSLLDEIGQLSLGVIIAGGAALYGVISLASPTIRSEIKSTVNAIT
ncbi:polysaccharide biosynthesis C-terminal domain-containing protein [Halobellus sp. Atlit-38R]|uniref:oligosaccharide flippase family protein n=2 Tax=Haloferacaceae TaxID=1644056 RepID=UPI001314DA48|nr:polysaccharide biosynthesis C-terminal domain-containing protein [Halobellus sp. Atlit-38R]